MLSKRRKGGGIWDAGHAERKRLSPQISLTLNPIPHQNQLAVLMNGGAPNAMLLLHPSKPNELQHYDFVLSN